MPRVPGKLTPDMAIQRPLFHPEGFDSNFVFSPSLFVAGMDWVTPPTAPVFSPSLFIAGMDGVIPPRAPGLTQRPGTKRRVGEPLGSQTNLAPRVLFPPLIDGEQADDAINVVPVSCEKVRKRVGMFRYNIDDPWPSVSPSDVGACDVVCDHCHALRWKGETKGMCCRNGAVQLPPLLEPPSPLWLLLNDTTSEAKNFRTNIRKYNAALMMASSTAKVQHNFGGGPGAFRINGTVHHRMGALIPPSGIAPQFAQVYVLDHADQLRARQGMYFGDSLDPSILQALGSMLEESNEFVKQFQRAASLDAPNLCLRIATTSGFDRRRYNLPTADQIAVFLPDQEMNTASTPRDIVVRVRGD